MSYSEYFEEKRKHMQKEKEEKNFNLFIPCYDVLNKEIYFFNFFNEDIVDMKSIDLSSKEVITVLMNQDPNFYDFINKDEINFKKLLPKLLSLEENEKLEKHLTKFKQNWEKMKILTKFNAISTLGGEYKNYFRRPYYSRFVLSENLKLYSFNSTTNIPQVLKTYTMSINVAFDPCKLEDRNFFKKEEEDKLKSRPYINDISLTTIVDSLIKEVVDYFYNQLDSQKEKLNEILNKDGLKYIHVLKFKGREEYLYGDSLIGAYQFIRGRLREHETIYFYLKILPLYIVSPPLTNFPPIIRTTKANESYVNLLKNYLKQYLPNSGIIYRLLRPDEKLKKRFIKQKYKRMERLSRFTESCDCCFPLWIKIKHLNNIYSLKYWLDNEEYNKNEMLIPNLKYLERKTTQVKINKNNKSNSININKDDKNKKTQNAMDEKKVNDKAKKEENELRKKSLIIMARKSESDNILQKELNKLTIVKIKLNYTEYSINILSTNNILGDDIGECVNLLSLDEMRMPPKAQKVSSTENRRMINSEFNKTKSLINDDEKESELIEEPNSIIKNETDLIKPEKDKEYFLGNLLYEKYKILILDKYQLPFSPPFIRIKVNLLYGSYSILSFRSAPYIFQNHINLNDKFLFDNSCLISNLPFETRIAITLEAYDKSLNNSFNLGSCQIPLYRSDGQIQSGPMKINIWPNISISPRFNNCSSFGLSTKHKTKIDAIEKGSYPSDAEKYKLEIMEKMEDDFKNIIRIYNREKKEKFNENNIDILIKKVEEKEKKKSGDNNNNNNNNQVVQSLNYNQNTTKHGHENKNETQKKNEINNNNDDSDNIINEFNDQQKEGDNENNSDNNLFSSEKNKDYCSISLEFPTYSSPMIYSQNSYQSYRDYLQIKYKKNSTAQMKEEEDDFQEIRKLYGNSQRDIKFIVDNFRESEFSSGENIIGSKGGSSFGRNRDNEYENNFGGYFGSKYNNQNDSNEIYPKDIWAYIKKTMPMIVKILKKDPLDKLEETEITTILVCRDYISTIPSALELFLRAIDWLNPLQVSIAHEYIKKWAKLQVEDAISLLDARFPDTETREFAVRMLRDLPDELINMYMLQLCQCLLYETFLVNPLSDFLIERSLTNPKLIGNAFFWNSRVSMKNPLFSDRLTIYLLTILMYSGENFLNNCFNGLYLNDYFEFMTYFVKLKKQEVNGDATEYAKVFLDFFTNQLKMIDFTFPIDPTYFGTSFGSNWQVFSSKMLPTKIVFKSREKDESVVIFKIGDDLRQDVLTLQIFNIMDKLWLENNLDLKLLPYKVCPTELKAGFIECLVGIELDQLQAEDGVAGVLDRELIVKYLRKSGKQNSSLETKFDNFIKSLAGYCVATCVIGIGDRHPGNIMIKENGIFFHIDFGHILGNFKSKFCIKRERTPFLLTPMMANVYSTVGKEEFFKTACVKAYNILRHNAQRLINMFIIMSTAGMPELCSMGDVGYAKTMLKLDIPNDEDAGNYFVALIKQSKNDRFRLVDNIFHYLKHRKPKKKTKGKDNKDKKGEKEEEEKKEGNEKDKDNKDKEKDKDKDNHKAEEKISKNNKE